MTQQEIGLLRGKRICKFYVKDVGNVGGGREARASEKTFFG